MDSEFHSHPIPLGRRRRTGSIRHPLIFLLACLCLVLSSCYPWLYPTTKGPPIKLQIIAGTTKTIVLDKVDNARDLGGVDFAIFGVGQQNPSRGNFRVTSKQIGDKTLQLSFETDIKTREDIYKGWLPLRFGLGQTGIISPITIHVIEPSDDFIPRGAAIPSADRIVRDKDGQLVVKDELIVMLPIFAPSALDSVVAERSRKKSVKRDRVVEEPVLVCPPDNKDPRWIPSLASLKTGSFTVSKTRYSVTSREGGYYIAPEEGSFVSPAVESPHFIVPDIGTAERAVCAITGGTVNVNGEEKPVGGEFIGSIPETRSFQMRFADIHTLEDLAEKRRLIIENFPGVSTVSRSFVAEGQPASAHDVYHTGNLPGTMDFNNVHNETIYNNAKVGEAWDLTTGHNNVRVAVIDCEFLDTHPDFDSNVDTVSGVQSGCGKHGTMAAGIIGAEATFGADSGPGIAGLAPGIMMRLYDPLGGIDNYAAETHPDVFPSQIAFPTAEAMFNAISEDLTGPRATRTLVAVVNQAFHQTNQYLSNPPELNDVDETSAILNQSILFALKSSKEVLWIFPAGNEGRDARYQSPASLSWWYPLDTITVANVDATGSPPFTLTPKNPPSNNGPLITVGAPGYELASTWADFEGNPDYWTFDGTSAAAPFVAGVAALVLSKMEEDIAAGVTTAEGDITDDWPAWKIRQCITASADGNIAGVSDFKLINAANAIPRLTDGHYDCIPAERDPSLPANQNIDIIFAFDTTGSMGREIEEVKRHAGEILYGLRDAFDAANPSPSGVELRFGVVSYEDYPGGFDSSTDSAGVDCPDPPKSEYQGVYGRASSGDEPYRVHHKLTDPSDGTITAIEGLATKDGADGPESYGRVFYEIAMAAEQATPDDVDPDLGFKKDSLKIIINLGDSFPHDNDLNGGDLTTGGCTETDPDAGVCKYNILNPTFNGEWPLFSGSSSDTGIDPGRNGSLECGREDGDDIDFQIDALKELEEQKIRLLHIDSSGRKDIYAPYWSTWTRGTRGAYVPINSDGSVPNGIDLPALILSFVRQIAKTPDP